MGFSPPPHRAAPSGVLSGGGAGFPPPGGARVRTGGAGFSRPRSPARPLLASSGGGTRFPPRGHPPPLAGPVPPQQALAYGAGAVLGWNHTETAPRLRALAQKL